MNVLTQNMWLLPAFLSVGNRRRRDKLVKLLRKGKYDVVTLQEVWQRFDVEYLKWKLDDIYYVTNSHDGLFNFGGLVTLTKVKPHYSIFEQFEVNEDFNFEERYMGKGILTTRIKHGNTNLDIINSHLYSPKSKEDEKLFLTVQLKQVIQQSKRSDIAIIAGDFNMELTQYQNMLIGLNWNSEEDEHTVTKENVYKHMRLNRLRDENARFDHILTRGISNSSNKTKVLKEPLLSDHYGVETKIEFS